MDANMKSGKTDTPKTSNNSIQPETSMADMSTILPTSKDRVDADKHMDTNISKPAQEDYCSQLMANLKTKESQEANYYGPQKTRNTPTKDNGVVPRVSIQSNSSSILGKLKDYEEIWTRILTYAVPRSRTVVVKFHPDKKLAYSSTPPPVTLHINRYIRTITLRYMKVLQPFKEQPPIYFEPNTDTIEICGAVDHEVRRVFIDNKSLPRSYTLEVLSYDNAPECYGVEFIDAVKSIQRINLTFSSLQRFGKYWFPFSLLNKSISTRMTGLMKFTGLRELNIELKPSVSMLEPPHCRCLENFQMLFSLDVDRVLRWNPNMNFPTITTSLVKNGKREVTEVFSHGIFISITCDMHDSPASRHEFTRLSNIAA